jgi:hypothetical protein
LPEKREQNRKRTREWYASHRMVCQRYKKLNRHKTNAEAFARHHVNVGSQCEICDSTENLERHHPDYAERLVVVTVCRACHVNIHKS